MVKGVSRTSSIVSLYSERKARKARKQQLHMGCGVSEIVGERMGRLAGVCLRSPVADIPKTRKTREEMHGIDTHHPSRHNAGDPRRLILMQVE